ncbi:hypothetical protein TSTA_013070 [Talaromyces stipitatus ATCC 10500]|uniref:Uncharacterized protein n=1 Tax=Talaromyces stipitatus (strain ATCC 10500 / CBS 375.48 / QM 6759 / NRRL 1006) TaxID=441959 RepID=B8MFA2_TALSN|nr:uncharacterized protein TSTA_013070 [Talaromyces stipitatus ATCC 10500]EED16201.1 hypothetical protein TSTA_013070 [Talaromyces stipitatus ATCC 10500]
MIEDGAAYFEKKSPLGVSEDLAEVTRKIHSLWHAELLSNRKEPGWGHRFDAESNRLFGEAAVLLEKNGKADDVYKSAIAYGRLSNGLPYVPYHTIDAIILANVTSPNCADLMEPQESSRPDRSSESAIETWEADQEIEQPELPPADRGRGAWLALLGCVLAQVPIWGFSLA